MLDFSLWDRFGLLQRCYPIRNEGHSAKQIEQQFTNRLIELRLHPLDHPSIYDVDWAEIEEANDRSHCDDEYGVFHTFSESPLEDHMTSLKEHYSTLYI